MLVIRVLLTSFAEHACQWAVADHIAVKAGSRDGSKTGRPTYLLIAQMQAALGSAADLVTGSGEICLSALHRTVREVDGAQNRNSGQSNQTNRPKAAADM